MNVLMETKNKPENNTYKSRDHECDIKLEIIELHYNNVLQLFIHKSSM
jgi:hypothetical protein